MNRNRMAVGSVLVAAAVLVSAIALLGGGSLAAEEPAVEEPAAEDTHPGPGFMMRHHAAHAFGPGHPVGWRSEVLTDLLGLSPEDLREELAAGKTLAQVAEAQGVDRDSLKETLLAALAEHLEEAVAQGHLTTEQADARLEMADAAVDRLLDHEGLPGWGRPGWGGRHGNGPCHGEDTGDEPETMEG